MTDRFEVFWNRFSEWSQATFGPDHSRGPEGPLKHLQKEISEELLGEVKGMPKAGLHDIEEYADLIFLAFDACRRAGFTYHDLWQACMVKLEINKGRQWGPTSTTEPTEHIRDENETAHPFFEDINAKAVDRRSAIKICTTSESDEQK